MANKKIIDKLKKYAKIFAVAVLFMCCLIFIMSSQNSDESTNSSDFFVNICCKIFFPEYFSMPPAEKFDLYIFIVTFVRKGAHFTEYLILGQLVFELFSVLPKPKKMLSCMIAAQAFASIFAMTDEFHQNFVPGRAMRFTDVLIDSSGALLGILIAAAVQKYCRKKIS